MVNSFENTWESYYLDFDRSNKTHGVNDWKQRLSCLEKWVRKDLKVLDLGCGIGIPSFIFKNYTGTDIDGMCIKYGKKHGINIINMDCNDKFKFNDNEFDVVLALNIIEHIKNPIFFLNEIKRVLKKGGHAIFSTPNVNIIRKYIKPVKDHLHFWNISKFKKMLIENSFEVLDVGYIGKIRNSLLCQTFMVLSTVKS